LILTGNVYPSEVLEVPQQGGSIYTYFGWGLFGLLMVVTFLACPFIASGRLQRHYLFLYVVGVLLVIFNPLLWPILAYVAGNLPIRIYWAIPFAGLFAFFVISLMYYLTPSFLPKKTYLNCCLFFSVAFFACSIVYVDRQVGVDIAWSTPKYKVRQPYYAIAKDIVDNHNGNCRVLLPEPVASNLVMIEGHPYPIAVRDIYQKHYRHTMGSSERLLRSKLFESLNGSPFISVEDIALGIKKLNINLILIDKNSLNYKNYHEFSMENGFVMKLAAHNMSLFFKACK